VAVAKAVAKSVAEDAAASAWSPLASVRRTYLRRDQNMSGGFYLSMGPGPCELLRILLLGTWVNKLPADVSGSAGWHHA
jgi:hypothetical protein